MNERTKQKFHLSLQTQQRVLSRFLAEPFQALGKGDHYNQPRCFSKVTREMCHWMTRLLFHLTVLLIYIKPLLI